MDEQNKLLYKQSTYIYHTRNMSVQFSLTLLFSPGVVALKRRGDRVPVAPSFVVAICCYSSSTMRSRVHLFIVHYYSTVCNADTGQYALEYCQRCLTTTTILFWDRVAISSGDSTLSYLVRATHSAYHSYEIVIQQYHTQVLNRYPRICEQHHWYRINSSPSPCEPFFGLADVGRRTIYYYGKAAVGAATVQKTKSIMCMYVCGVFFVDVAAFGCSVVGSLAPVVCECVRGPVRLSDVQGSRKGVNTHSPRPYGAVS